MLPFPRDCISKEPAENEILIFGNSDLCERATKLRDRHLQATMAASLSLTPKRRTRLDLILQDVNVQSLVMILGAGFDLSPWSDHSGHYDPGRLRYGRVILVFDYAKEEERKIAHQTVQTFRLLMPGVAPVVWRPEPRLRNLDAELVYRKAMDPTQRKLVRVHNV